MSGTLAVLAASVEGGRLGSMFVFFLIALVIVSPFGYRRIRAILRERRAAAPAAPVVEVPTDEDDPGDDLAAVVAAISGAALAPGESCEVEVPASPLVEGRPAPDVVVETLINDAVRRSGLTSRWVDVDGRRTLRLTRSAVH